MKFDAKARVAALHGDADVLIEFLRKLDVDLDEVNLTLATALVDNKRGDLLDMALSHVTLQDTIREMRATVRRLFREADKVETIAAKFDPAYN